MKWSAPPEHPELRRAEAHVWRIRLERPSASVRRLRGELSTDEQERAARFHFEADQLRFIVSHAALRQILGAYVDRPPRDLNFAYGPKDKPRLVDECGGREVRFNLSHSSDVALVAVTGAREVGVDVERIRGLADRERLARRFFSPQEVAVLEGLPSESRDLAFFTCWTRKEAYLKGLGGGISIGLDKFDVSLVPGEPAALLRHRTDPGETSRWSLRDLEPGLGYAGALAVETPCDRVLCLDWEQET